jgi:hypothetical protein
MKHQQQQQPTPIIIDLTDLSDSEPPSELSFDENACPLCFEKLKTPYEYDCCHHLCCLACFRLHHIERNITECPFDRTKQMKINFNCPMKLNYIALHKEVSGVIEVLPNEFLSVINEKIFSSNNSWSIEDRNVPYIFRHGNENLELCNIEIYMTNLIDGDTLYINTKK